MSRPNEATVELAGRMVGMRLDLNAIHLVESTLGECIDAMLDRQVAEGFRGTDWLELAFACHVSYHRARGERTALNRTEFGARVGFSDISALCRAVRSLLEQWSDLATTEPTTDIVEA